VTRLPSSMFIVIGKQPLFLNDRFIYGFLVILIWQWTVALKMMIDMSEPPP